jgi:hypothetical protein
MKTMAQAMIGNAGTALLWSSLFAVCMAQSLPDAAPGDGIHFATQTVVPDEGGVAPAAQTRASQSPATQARQTPLNDMAFISTNKVVSNSLGLIIHNQNGQAVSVVIHDSKGRRVFGKRYAADLSVINVKTGNLDPGAYIYSVAIGDSLFTRPFFVTHH